MERLWWSNRSLQSIRRFSQQGYFMYIKLTENIETKASETFGRGLLLSSRVVFQSVYLAVKRQND